MSSIPTTVRVKISSEAGGSIALSAVVVQDMPSEELMRSILGVTGKDAARIAEILARGSIVAGASRFRWEPLRVEAADLAAHLARYPDSDPSRRFDPDACIDVVFRGANAKPLALSREAGEKRRWFRRRSFWQELMSIAAAPEYVEYSYRESADVYRQALDAAARERLRRAASLLAYSALEAQMRAEVFTSVELRAKR